MQWLGRISCACALLATLTPGCRRHVSAATFSVRTATTHPSDSPLIGGSYRNDGLDVALTYPPGWATKSNADYVWMIVPQKVGASGAISLEVPSLPPHIPGMIPLRLVKNGYVDDLKTGKQSFMTSESTPTVAGANAKLMKSTWSDKGSNQFEAALILVHANRVYILRAEGAVADESVVMPTFELVRQSLHWAK